jgi:hypothetical protein
MQPKSKKKDLEGLSDAIDSTMESPSVSETDSQSELSTPVTPLTEEDIAQKLARRWSLSSDDTIEMIQIPQLPEVEPIDRALSDKIKTMLQTEDESPLNANPLDAAPQFETVHGHGKYYEETLRRKSTPFLQSDSSTQLEDSSKPLRATKSALDIPKQQPSINDILNDVESFLQELDPTYQRKGTGTLQRSKTFSGSRQNSLKKENEDSNYDSVMDYIESFESDSSEVRDSRMSLDSAKHMLGVRRATSWIPGWKSNTVSTKPHETSGETSRLQERLKQRIAAQTMPRKLSISYNYTPDMAQRKSLDRVSFFEKPEDEVIPQKSALSAVTESPLIPYVADEEQAPSASEVVVSITSPAVAYNELEISNLAPSDTVLPPNNDIAVNQPEYPQAVVPSQEGPLEHQDSFPPAEIEPTRTDIPGEFTPVHVAEVVNTEERNGLERAVPIENISDSITPRVISEDHDVAEIPIEERVTETSILQEVDTIIRDIPKGPILSLQVPDLQLEADLPTPRATHSSEMVRSPTPPPKDDHLLTPRPISIQSVKSLQITSSDAISETDSEEGEFTETECDSECDSNCDGVHEYTDSSSTNESGTESEADDESTRSVPSKRDSTDLESIMMHLSKLNSPELDEQRADDPTIRRKAKIEKSLQPVYETLGQLEGSVDPEILESVYRSLGTLKREAGRPSSVHLSRDGSMEVQISNQHMLFKENDFETNRKHKGWMQKLKKRMSFGFLSRKKDL